MTQIKIFGREPALWIGLIGALFTTAAGMGLDFLSAGQASAIVGALSALIIAIFTRPIAPALFTAALVALVAAVSQYGLHLSDHLVASLSGLILASFAMFGIRPQVTPANDQRAISPSTGRIG